MEAEEETEVAVLVEEEMEEVADKAEKEWKVAAVTKEEDVKVAALTEKEKVEPAGVTAEEEMNWNEIFLAFNLKGQHYKLFGANHHQVFDPGLSGEAGYDSNGPMYEHFLTYHLEDKSSLHGGCIDTTLQLFVNCSLFLISLFPLLSMLSQ